MHCPEEQGMKPLAKPPRHMPATKIWKNLEWAENWIDLRMR